MLKLTPAPAPALTLTLIINQQIERARHGETEVEQRSSQVHRTNNLTDMSL